MSTINSCLQMFFRIGVLKNFVIFTEKQLCLRDPNTYVFLWILQKFFRTAFFIEHLQRLLPELIVELYARSKCFIKYYLYDCRKLVYGVGAETVFLKLTQRMICYRRHRCSRSQMLFRISVLKNFTIFTGNYMCWNLFLIKLQAFNFPKKWLHHRVFLWLLGNF